MAQFDLPLDELRRYQPALPEPADLGEFWAGTLSEARAHPLDATFTPVDNQLAVIDSWDGCTRTTTTRAARGSTPLSNSAGWRACSASARPDRA